MVAHHLARRSFGPARLAFRPVQDATNAQCRGFSSSSRVFGVLGLGRLDIRQQHEQEEAARRSKTVHKSLANYNRPPPKGPPTVYRAPPSARAHCKDPIAALTAMQLTELDPNGSRQRLFAESNPEAAKVGDILLVRQRNGDPFAGVCLNIKKNGIDTAILLRNQLTRVGVEMWYKIYSPNVTGIEVVQRRQKRARRARLYYMRKPKHDLGSVENIVNQYLRQRQALRSGREARGRDANSGKKKSAKSK